MQKKDYTGKLLTVYKEILTEGNGSGSVMATGDTEPGRSWSDLVEQATSKGIESMEVNDLVRMARFAKEILR